MTTAESPGRPAVSSVTQHRVNPAFAAAVNRSRADPMAVVSKARARVVPACVWNRMS
jgi:hypothetical protein